VTIWRDAAASLPIRLTIALLWSMEILSLLMTETLFNTKPSSCGYILLPGGTILEPRLAEMKGP